ncbi:unnamed protein product [Closterium sp. NIES-65]|nr:unnamed protein product [Closterium sp. NIES-65]
MSGFPALLALLAFALILASDVIRAACGQDMLTDVSATPPPAVATAITVGSTFAFNFTAARCTNLQSTLPNATVQWTSAAAATAKLPACENITLWTGPDCTGVVASFLAKPSSPTTYTTRTILSSPYPLSALCFIAGDAPWWPTEVAARVVVATAVAVGAYKVAFDPSSRCAGVPAGTAPAGVSTPVSVRWDAPCTTLAFFPGSSCSGAVLKLMYSFSSSNSPSIKPSSPLASIRCSFSSSTACNYATCPANSVCAGTSDNRVATCKCDKGYIGINGTCQDKCNLNCVAANTRCVRDANGVPDCVCNKGFQYASDSSNTCVDKCSFVNCGPNGKCIKDANGNATCACNAGFQMPPNKITCIDKCEFVTCKANSTCVKDANGNTTCECIKGFERLPGNDTCVDKCAAVDCGPGGTCKTDAYGIPACNCTTGFKLSSDKLSCIDMCGSVDCGTGGTCKTDAKGNAYCSCMAGYVPTNNMLTCIDRCASLSCGPGGMCEKDASGNPFCNCNKGFEQSADKLTCIDICASMNCGVDATCFKSYEYDDTVGSPIRV